MNTLKITENIKTKGPQKVELTLSPAIHDIFMHPLEQAYHLPILQGERKELEGGMMYYCFYLNDDEAEMLSNAFMQAYTKESGYNTPN